MYKVTLIPGDGIGPEVAAAMVKVVESTGAKPPSTTIELKHIPSAIVEQAPYIPQNGMPNALAANDAGNI